MGRDRKEPGSQVHPKVDPPHADIKSGCVRSTWEQRREGREKEPESERERDRGVRRGVVLEKKVRQRVLR